MQVCAAIWQLQKKAGSLKIVRFYLILVNCSLLLLKEMLQSLSNYRDVSNIYYHGNLKQLDKYFPLHIEKNIWKLKRSVHQS